MFIVEGEKCVHAAEHLGLVATTAPNGALAWRDYYSTWFIGCSRVTIIADNDDAGHKYAGEVAVSLRGKDIPVRTVTSRGQHTEGRPVRPRPRRVQGRAI